MKSIKKIFILLAIAMLMFSFVLATSYAVSVPSNEKKDTGIFIESKSKIVSYKITWNANGGKIETEKTVTTSVKKGSKINKFATTPKRNEYTFKGWYTKKNGGTKISKNTKPTKSVTYYAQWNKESPNLSATEKKLVGAWTRKYTAVNTRDYTFIHSPNKTYTYTYTLTSVDNRGRISVEKTYYKGSWSASGNTLYYTDVKKLSYDGKSWLPINSQTNKITFAQDEKGLHYIIGDVNNNAKFYKVA